MSDWKTIDLLPPEDQVRARKLFSESEVDRIPDYEFSEFGTKLLRRVMPSKLATEKKPAAVKRKRPNLADRTDMGQADGSPNPAVDQVIEVPLSAIVLCPFNPRKHYDEEDLKAFAENIGSSGIIQPLVCRAHSPEPYEVIAGHRRLRAAQIAGLATAPIILRVMDDRKALGVMLGENLQRKRLNPMEEAAGIRAWIDMGRYDSAKEAITAAAVAHGLNPVHVYQILSLLKLPPRARTALETKKLTKKHGFLIARQATEAIRRQMTIDILKGHDGKIALDIHSADELAKRNYSVDLRTAPFDTTDRDLVPLVEVAGERVSGGACWATSKPYSYSYVPGQGDIKGPRPSDCPWNTINIPGAEDVHIHRCTNIMCYRAKLIAHSKHLKDAALQKGSIVIEGERAKRLIYHDGTPNFDSGMVRLDAKPTQYEVVAGRKPPTWGKMVSGAVAMRTTLVIDEHGAAHELVERKLAIEAAKKNGFEDLFNARATRAKSSGHAEQLAREGAEKEKQKLESRLAVLGLEELCSQIAKEGVAWLPMLELGLFHAGSDGEAFICHRREIEVTKGEHGQPEREKALRKYAATLTLERLPAFIVELLLAGWMKHRGVEAPGFVGLAGAYEIDVKALRSKAKAEFAEKSKPKASKKAKSEPEPEPVREKIIRMGTGRGMTPGAYELMAAHVLAKPFESNPFENARGDELNFILEKLQQLSEHDPDDGWIPHDEALMCPRCGTEFKNPPGDMPQVACAPACKYSGKVPRPYFKGKGKKGGTK